MNEKTAIITDSCSDISLAQGKDLGIEIIPLHIIYKEEQYKDLVEISADEVYDRLEEEIPTTSIPSLGEIEKVFDNLLAKGYNKFIVTTISSGLSGIYNACKQVVEKKSLDAFVFDTKNIGIISGVFSLYAAQLRDEGRKFEEIKGLLIKNARNAHGYYTIKTLKYLMKGGRIGLVSGMFAGMLNIKPIIACNEEGIYYTVKKSRGNKKAIIDLANLFRKHLKKPYWLFLCQGRNQKGLELLKHELKNEWKEAARVQENQITAALGIHTGPGLVGGVIFVPEE